MKDRVVEQELYDDIRGMEIVDCHEHLVPEERALEDSADFTTLFSHYCKGGFRAAGMSDREQGILYAADTPPEQKWEIFSKYFPLVEDTAYGKSAKIVIAEEYGIEELTKENYMLLSERVQQRRKPGYYRDIFTRCGIRYVLNNPDHERLPHGAYFFPSDDVMKAVPRVPKEPHREDFLQEDTFFTGVKTVEDLDQRAVQLVEKTLQAGGKALKLAAMVPYAEVNVAEARTELERLLQTSSGFSIKLFWYVLDRILDAAAEVDLPIAVHTGYWGDFRELSPTKLIPLIDRHPDNRFDLFHLGYPYVKESLAMAKTRHNVVLDLCWTYLISQQFAGNGIRQIVDLLPMNKVMGFGGDYGVAEKLYGHREMMNRTMARALADKVTDGTLTLARAKLWAKAMLWDNPVAFYRLDGE